MIQPAHGRSRRTALADVGGELAQRDRSEIGKDTVEHRTIALAGDHRSDDRSAVTDRFDRVPVPAERTRDCERRTALRQLRGGANHHGAGAAGQGLRPHVAADHAANAADQFVAGAQNLRRVSAGDDPIRHQRSRPRAGRGLERRVAQPRGVTVFSRGSGGEQQQQDQRQKDAHGHQL